MKALDLFCGLGGWSDGLAMEGFNCLGVEINSKIARKYKHDVIVSDVSLLEGSRFKGFDLIVGSPPCRDFSYFALKFGKTWKKNPPNIKRGLSLIHSFIRFVEDANPKYWLMENIPPLLKHFKLKPKCITYLGGKPRMRRVFWGKFPFFLIPSGHRLPMRNHSYQKGRKTYSSSAERSRIPLPVAQALGKIIRDSL